MPIIDASSACPAVNHQLRNGMQVIIAYLHTLERCLPVEEHGPIQGIHEQITRMTTAMAGCATPSPPRGDTPMPEPVSKQTMADCVFLALCLWREARGENRLTRIGVAMAVMNRVARPAWWGRSVCEVLFKRWQFSSLTDPNDRQLTTWPLPNDPSWRECLSLAAQVLDKLPENPVPGADSYFDTSLPADKWPAWATTARFVGQLGRIRFYDVDHDHEDITRNAI